MHFPTDFASVLDRIDQVDPIAYERTRNYTDGAVTYLSPYISRGVISPRRVLHTLIEKGYSYNESEKLVQELAWREYFQRVWEFLEDDLYHDIRRRYTGVKNRKIPQSVLDARTGIEAIDQAIEELKETGYMHNHVRMYLASVACNIARSYWQMPAQWLYYHLLDGDIASNICSWQWVAGSFSSKPYYCNQDNINKYTGSQQKDSFLDVPYEALPLLAIPESLQELGEFSGSSTLPMAAVPVIDPSLPLYLYNSYNLDPLWHADKPGNRILLLEPSHFRDFAVSDKVMKFMLGLAKNIEGLQVFVGELNELPGLREVPQIISRKHPAFKHYPGIKEERDWLFPEVNGFYPSFFAYWKKCQPVLKQYFQRKAVLQKQD
jgi:deoxyribodipyrimidine photo-lyase